jgi:signal transduction histidine kinase/ligand-binding sensor domain-containing protein
MRPCSATAWLLAAWCTCVAAADTTLDVSQYRRTTWNLRDGFLEGARIVSMAQTPDGWLWLGTERGLFRFDGVTATRWRPPAGSGLPDEYVSALGATRDGTLWIGTFKGLARWRGGELATYPELSGHMIDNVLEDHEGTVWIATQRASDSGLLCSFREGTLRCEGGDGKFGRAVGSLFEDSSGKLWVSGVTGLWRIGRDAAGPIPVNDYGAGFQSLAADGDALLVADGRLRRLSDGRLEPVPWLPPDVRVSRILRDRHGAFWMATHDRGLLHAHDGRVDALGRADGYAVETVAHMFEDREGNLWVANVDGLDRFAEPRAAPLSWRQGLASRALGAVVASRDGGIWLSTATGVYRWRDGAFTVFRERSTPPANTGIDPIFGPRTRVVAAGIPEGYSSLLEDSRGRLWIGSTAGVGWLAGDRFVRAAGIPGGLIDAIAEDKDGNVWIANRDAGLFRWKAGSRLEKLPWAAFGHTDHGRRLAADPRKGLWIAFANGGIVHWADGRALATYGAPEGLPDGQARQVRADADGAIWVASTGGLTRLKDGRAATLNAACGLPCDSVDWIAEDTAGAYWLYMACGVVRIPRADMGAWMAASDRGAAQPKVAPSAILTDGDGVRTLMFRGSASPHMARAADGRLWLTSFDGAIVVDPARLTSGSAAPPVVVERIVADRDEHEASQALRLPPLVRDLRIDYTALTLTAPEKVRFRYKLEGRDRDWMDAGNRRRAFYTDLPPGDYRFRVVAASNAGAWNEQGAAIAFSIAPAWWQTTWFRVAAVLAVALLLYGIYRMRMRQVSRAFGATLDARVNERLRIARDLHDTLLQSFHGLILRFQAASSLLPARPVEAKTVLDNAIDQAAEAVTEGRDAVQGLRASSSETNDLADSISAFGDTLARERDDAPALRVEVQGASRTLHPILRDEIFRVAAEALRNAFRHSGATHVEVEIRYGERELRMRVRDDGKGISAQMLGRGRAGHYGLAGMRERAALIGGKLTVWSAPGAGTEVELAIPASHAYAARPSTGPHPFSDKMEAGQ